MRVVEMRGPSGAVMVPAEAVERYRGRGYTVVATDTGATRRDLESRTVAELREMVDARGLEVHAHAKKADIVDALLESMDIVDLDEEGVEYNAKED